MSAPADETTGAEQESTFRALVEGIPAAVYRRAPEPPRAFRYLSPGVESIAGRPATDLVRPGIATQALAPIAEDATAVTDAMRLATAAGRPFDLEYRVRHADGTLRWVHDRGRPERDAGGAVAWIDGVIFDVTERKQAEQGLEQQRAMLLVLMDGAPDNIYFKDADSRFTMIGTAMARSFGLHDPAEAVGRTDFDFFPEEHARPAFEDEQEVMRTGLPVVDREERETWPDGRQSWASTTKLPYRDAEGKVAGTFGISRDITARKAGEAALRDSETRIRAITDSVRDAIVMTDPGGRVGYWNPAAERMFGYAGAEAMGQELHALVVPSRHREAYLAAVSAVLETGLSAVVARTLELDARHRDGREFPVQLSLSAVELDGGWHAVGVVRDVTDSKRAQQALVEERALLQALMDNTPDHIYFKDAASRFTRISAAMASSLGLADPSDAIGKTDFDYFTQEQARLAFEDERSVMRSGVPVVDLEERETWPGGREAWASTTKLVRTDDDGIVVGTFGVSRDITHRKLVEAALTETNERLKAAIARATEMQDRLREAHEAVAYEAMHDPLTGVLNRRALSDVLARAVSAEGRHHGGPALGICDIDGFKAINDRQGDQAGDDALRGLVRVMTGTLRASDVLSRFGGDEFVVLAERIGTAAVETTFERVRAAVAASPISTGAGDVAITITFGVALWRDDDTEDRLFARADAALYRAKSEGRDRVCIAGETQP